MRSRDRERQSVLDLMPRFKQNLIAMKQKCNCSLIIVTLLMIAFFINGCNDYLDVKSDDKLVVPKTVEDLQSLLDYYDWINKDWPGSTSEASADDYYISSQDYSALSSETDRHIYTWEKEEIFPPSHSNEWTKAYKKVYIANAVLDEMKQMDKSLNDDPAWKNVQGQALFLRSAVFLSIAYMWSLAYDDATADIDLGIPLRLNSNFNEPSTRSTVRQTYNQILKDLTRAASLLPDHALHPVRPSRATAYAYLARTYLSMRNYEKAGLYADSCLQLHNTLLDYNDGEWIDSSAGKQFGIRKPFNPEILYDVKITPSPLLNLNRYQKVDSVLYRAYDMNDLRRLAFFRSNNDGSHTFVGGYTGAYYLFGGIATDEVLLMRAESYARADNVNAAMRDLNLLLEKRWKQGTFSPLVAVDKEEALKFILLERRKELLFRSLRWMDLKRLNKEGLNIVQKRVINGKLYTLPPNDLRYALPIPDDIIDFTNMKQNVR